MQRPHAPMSRFIIALIILFQIITHWFILPLSTHSGQTSIPWMMNQGRVLFGDIWEQHAPATSVIAALAQRILPFSEGDIAKLLNIALVIGLTLGLVTLARRLAGGADWAAVLTAAVWAWWAPVYGNVLFYFNTLLALFVVLGLIALIDHSGHVRRNWRHALIAGLWLGLATLAKQQGWAAVGLIGLGLVMFTRNPRVVVAYVVGALIAPALTVAVIAMQGNLDSYIFWNWTFNLSSYMDGVPLDSHFLRKLVLSNVFVPAFALMIFKQGERRGAWALVLAMWFAGAILLYPRFGESAAASHMPFAALMSGVMLAQIVPPMIRAGWRDLRPAELTLSGVGLALAIGWLWTGAVMFLPSPVGSGATLAYDEFAPVASALNAMKQEDDTLFVLPETDSTPQLHPLTEMLPPATWIKGWYWYFEPDFVLDTLLSQWADTPPTYIIVFPDLIAEGQPGIDVLLAVVDERYTLLETIPDIYGHGDAQIYRLSSDSTLASR